MTDELRVPLGGAVAAVLKVSESTLVQRMDDDEAGAVSCTMVVFSDVEKPPPRKRMVVLRVQVPVHGQDNEVELLNLTIDIDLDGETAS
jgi:hypothetical protein